MRTEIEKAIKKTFTCFDVLAFLAKSKKNKKRKTENYHQVENYQGK